MRKNILAFVCFLGLAVSGFNQVAFATDISNFTQHYEAGQNYFNQGQYSSAIGEFSKSLRVNFMDNSARIGLVNAYIARASYFANQEKNYDKAANDFRSALFYLKMYPVKNQAVDNSTNVIASATENLNQCLKVVGGDRTPGARYKKAEELRAIGNFSAAAYEFSKAAQSENISADCYSQIADLMKLLANDVKAADYYKMAVELKPNDGLLKMKYARTLDKIGEFDKAVVEYNDALANSKGDMEILYALERIYLKKLAVTPSDAELNANLGAIKQAQGDFNSALSYYGRAEQINPSNVNTRLNVGTLFQQMKDYSKALSSYDSVLTLYPDNEQANLYKAQVLSEMGNKSEALIYYQKVLRLNPDNKLAQDEIASVVLATKTPEEYIEYLSQHASNLTNQNMLYDYAYKNHKENKTDIAIKAYKAFINVNSNKVDAYVNLAICYASKDDFKSAENILNIAKTKFPNNAEIAKTLKEVKDDSTSTTLASANASYENKDYNKAIQQYLAISPATEDSLLGIASCYQAQENYPKAIEYYKKAELVNPNNENIPYYIGYLYSEQKKWVEAEGFLRKSVKIKPQNDVNELLKYVVENRVSVMLDEGIDLYEKANYTMALPKFNDIIAKDSQNAYAYYYRALIYDEQKKQTLAISDYKNVLKYSKDFPIANYMIAVDLDSLKNYKEAFKYYNQFISAYDKNDEFLTYAKSRVVELKPYASK